MTPYANFRFRVKWDNTYVLGVSRVSGLIRSTPVIQYREGGNPSHVHVAPGQNFYEPITLKRGVSYDNTFEQWANKAIDWPNSGITVGQNVSLLDFRKDLTIEVYNEAGMKVIAYNVHHAWVSELSAMAGLNGVGNALVIESVTLQNEGWERDDSIVDVTEPTFVLPGKGPQA